MKKHIFLAVIAGCMLSGCDGRSDQEKIQGEWELREMWGWFTFDLTPFRKDDREALAFDGNRFSFTNNPRAAQHVSGTFFCDPTKRPKEITFTWRNRTVIAAYSLSGDDLTICVGTSDTTPPTTFDGGPGERPALILFRRGSPK